eukprot:14026975-Ditylum_brightwellii.AAC.1
MYSYISLGSLVSILYERTGIWYLAVIIVEGRGFHGTFYRVVWAEPPLHERDPEAVINNDNGACTLSAFCQPLLLNQYK